MAGLSRYLFLAASLPFLLLGALILLIGRNEAAFRAQAAIFVPFALIAAAVYVVLAVKYWFRIPIAGCALALALLVGSWIALMVESK